MFWKWDCAQSCAARCWDQRLGWSGVLLYFCLCCISYGALWALQHSPYEIQEMVRLHFYFLVFLPAKQWLLLYGFSLYDCSFAIGLFSFLDCWRWTTSPQHSLCSCSG